MSEFWIETTATGQIVDWSEGVPGFLNYPPRGLGGRSLILMFVADRPTPAVIEPALGGHSVEGHNLLQPKDRKPVPVAYRIERVGDRTSLGQPLVRWTITIKQPEAPRRR